MSGGVDSAVAAALLKDDGYDVVACFMRLGSDDPDETCDDSFDFHDSKGKFRHQGCCSLNDASDARQVAAILNVPFYVLNFRRDFDRVIEYFVQEDNIGRTPNPCVRCNDWLKFGKLADYARSIDADYVATGHYARISHGNGQSRLMRGCDHNKDQSYVLFGTPRAMLDHMLLPIGGLKKKQTRQIAEQCGLPIFDKPDSQEICFVPDNDYTSLLRKKAPGTMKPGVVLDLSGNVVGQHEGQQHFTIGQRRGVGVALGYPVYVVDKDPSANTVTVGDKEELFTSRLTANQANWLIDPPPMGELIDCHVKIRYNSEPVPGRVATDSDLLAITFDEPQLAVTPGQAVVCYHGEQLICGGWIDRNIVP